MRNILIAASICLSTSSAFAATATPAQPTVSPAQAAASFLNLIQGKWHGSGKMQTRSQTFAVHVQASESAVSSTSWNFETAISGTPVASDTVTNYEIAAKGLVVRSTQFVSVAKVSSATAARLTFKTTHQDQNTGNLVTTSRDLTLQSNQQLRLVSDIYQNGQLVQHFDYSLVRE